MSDEIVKYRGPEEGGNLEYEWSNAYLAAHLVSDVGRKRERNEDGCLLCVPSKKGDDSARGYTFAVADGMGGASGGQHASSLALQTFMDEYCGASSDNIPSDIRESIETANRTVYDEAEENPEYHGMGTTLSVLTIFGDCAYVGQVGDSRVYLSRPGEGLYQITEDHSLVAEQLRGGLISEEEAKNHALKNLITRAIGIKEAVEVDLFSLRIEKDDTLLICSDGLCNMVDDEDISNALQLDEVRASARILVGKALEAGGNDNISVELIRVTDNPPQSRLHEGCALFSPPSSGFWNKVKRIFS